MMEQYPTREYLSDEEFKARYKRADWKILRAQALKRDGYKCRVCGKGGKLAVHHTPEAYASFGNERLEDLVTLCWKHHPKGNYSRFAIDQDRQAVRELEALKTIVRCLSWSIRRLWLGIKWTAPRLSKVVIWTLLIFILLPFTLVFVFWLAVTSPGLILKKLKLWTVKLLFKPILFVFGD